VGSWSQLPPLAPAAPVAEPSLAALLSSPEAIADLLKDPARLRALLEQHPTLAAILQAQMKPK